MNCKQVQKNLNLFIDYEISKKEAREIEEHLSQCNECRKEFQRLKEISEIGDKINYPELPDKYWDELTNKIVNQLAKEKEKSFTIFQILNFFLDRIIYARLSYRLAGLAVAAVILFFFIKISFYDHGRFRLPQEPKSPVSTKKDKVLPPRIKPDSFVSSLKAKTSFPENVADEEAVSVHKPQDKTRKSISRREFALKFKAGAEKKDLELSDALSLSESEISEEPSTTVIGIPQGVESAEQGEMDQVKILTEKKRNSRFSASSFKTQRQTFLKKDKISIIAVRQEEKAFYNRLNLVDSLKATDEKLAALDSIINRSKGKRFRVDAIAKKLMVLIERAKGQKDTESIGAAVDYFNKNQEQLKSYKDYDQLKEQISALKKVEK